MGIFDFFKRGEKQPPQAERKDVPSQQFEYTLVPDPEKNETVEYATSAIWVPESKGDLNGVTQQIWTYAPYRYDEVYCPGGPPYPTLESDFDELRKGIAIIFRQKRFDDRRPILLNLVDEAYSAYKSGDRIKGMELINQVQAMTGKMR